MMTLNIFLWSLLCRATLANDQGNNQSSSQFRYAAMVDCGGSGSRGRIFVWPAATSSLELADKLVQLRDSKTGKVLAFKIRPGLSSVQAEPEKASEYMRPVMEFFNQNVPRKSQPETPVYFLATAGLRSLPVPKQQAIMANLKRDFETNYANFALIEAKVISGTQEGVYQWISVNSQAGRLTTPIVRATASLGLIEVGSESVQVAYELSEPLNGHNSRKLKFSPAALSAYHKSRYRITYGKRGEKTTVRLLSVSFPYLGTEAARKLQVRLMLLDKAATATTFEDPCLPVEVEETVVGGGVSREKVTQIGTGKFSACLVLLKRVLVAVKQEKSLGCETTSRDDCSLTLLGKPFVPFKYYRFLGLGELYYTTKEMVDSPGPLHAPRLRMKAWEMCSSPHSILLAKYPQANLEDKKRTMMECFKLLWIFTLLHLGFLMPLNSVGLVETLNQLNGNEIEWTRGALIERLTAL